MNFLIFLFVITLFTIVSVNLQAEGFILHPFVKGLIILAGSIFLTIFVYLKLKKMTSSQILFCFLGLFLGIFTGILLSLPLLILSSNLNFVAFSFITAFGYAGAIFGFKKAETIKIADILWIIKKEAIWEEPKILDTNVLIDGRIADLIELGFVKGTILIPRFVLREIQYIADSPDPLRRAKGRRALDILQRIKRAEKIRFEIVEKDIPEIKEVDTKLIELSRILKGTLITNDQNLIKIAQLRGVPVLNLNELAQAMRPPVLPGEVLRLFIVKEGKEPDQGVAYLDDGTMVVVEEGRASIGRTIDVVIHSVLQTGTGRMIFGKPKTDDPFSEKE
ncbi:PIN/TRAM domain-containing protein [Thermodesulfovibrio yellowstonii]|uniref:PIN/TRAM domain-containing protein n=1 Tax=Thermodesulfovibrio yellowstonii TaxID=28262 RepID=A0A9W6LJE4_9BACT|nr:PIN domain-containing protein [Thermodesulfovibrio islandicus]GLI52607.1 PIN/TRAM domain-containing protein [Thermodesulfovibrio islandicus]